MISDLAINAEMEITHTPLKQYRLDREAQLKDDAAALGVAPPVLHKWENGRVPAERCAHVETITGIPCHILRPDVFPVPATATEAA